MLNGKVSEKGLSYKMEVKFKGGKKNPIMRRFFWAGAMVVSVPRSSLSHVALG